ncbi:hypothetical protein QO010_002813 [Caulobacter ginsengisoli]|uniref:Uncharacterized protein n=1 Tax=Caulobacter ginsengisoli TaxID=400775 RepID=A0ABU0IVJ0_9CAUL|nr:hypothetical protein [Caulobacter ginsengisoli]MDQ0465029.1 hypothetical protein [Caulobacter ginsengisoli]
MPALAIALLLATAPAQPPQTWKGVLCAHDPGRNALVGSDIYYSYGAAKVWIVGRETLIPVDLTKLVEAKGKPFYTGNDTVVLNGRTYRKFGLPRVLKAQELEAKPEGFKDGVPFYRAGGGDEQVLYALSQAVGCEFQPYALTR